MTSKYFEDKKFNMDSIEGLEIFSSCEFVECEFSNIDFSNQKFNYTKFLECKFENCNLSNVEVIATSFREVSFQGCKMVGLNFSSSHSVFQTNFDGCALDYTVMQNLDLSNIKITKCSLKEADFSGCKLTGSSFEGSHLAGAIFTDADLTESDLRGATSYFIDPKYTQIKKAKFSMPEAMSLFSSLDILVDY